MKLYSIVGARPQFVKLAPLSHLIRSRGWTEKIVHTGQHYTSAMSDLFFEELGIAAPDYNLAVGSGEPGAQTARMLEGIERLIKESVPDAVMVFGDTNSTLAGALAASKMGVPLVHVEAGLRSFNRSMPEEINRVVADHLSDWLFAPTQGALGHLESEGLRKRAFLTGDITVDAVATHCRHAQERTGILETFGVASGEYSLLTLHRPYTVDDPGVLAQLLESLMAMEETILFPVHPRTQRTLERMGKSIPGAPVKTASSLRGRGGLRMIQPLGYLDFLCLQSHAGRILTDSGGIQKEAYLLRKPCITLRPETEWTETVDAGWNLLLPPDTPDLAERIRQFTPPEEQPGVFGEGVAEKMVQIMEERIGRRVG